MKAQEKLDIDEQLRKNATDQLQECIGGGGYVKVYKS